MTTTGSDNLLAAAVIALASLIVAVWCGAALAVVVTRGEVFDAGAGDAFAALLRLPRFLANPADAWPPSSQTQLPGPAAYWPCTIFSVGAIAASAVWLWLRFAAPRVGLEQRERLGVDPRSRMATLRDVAPLVVREPTRGRFALGRVHGRVVATEIRDTTRRRWRRVRRVGGRSTVAVIGPSQCGKTSNVVCSILEWDGPAVLSSVKNDLFEDTIRRRLRLGEVFVFDPLGEIDPTNMPKGWQLCGWSPLQSATTIGGAIAVANALLDAAPAEGMSNATYWSKKGEALLWPLLFAAAIGAKSMVDIVRWLALQDGERRPGDREIADADATPGGEVRDILNQAIDQDHDNTLAEEALLALQQFDSFWLLNERTRSDIFSTAQTLVQPWEDPRFAAASALEPKVELAWLLSGTGANTLYVSQPPKGAERLSVIFGGLLGDLVAEQTYDVAKRSGRALLDLLVVIDEAGNTPVRWLPQVASTCSGIGITLVTVWHSKSQIDARYQSLADSVLTNHATKVFFAGTSDQSTATYAAFLAGEEEVHNRSLQTQNGTPGTGSRGLTGQRVPLVNASSVRRAPPGHALLIHGTLPPADLRGRVLTRERMLQRVAAGATDTPPPVVLDERTSRALDALRVERARRLPTPRPLPRTNDAIGPYDLASPSPQSSP